MDTVPDLRPGRIGGGGADMAEESFPGWDWEDPEELSATMDAFTARLDLDELRYVLSQADFEPAAVRSCPFRSGARLA